MLDQHRGRGKQGEDQKVGTNVVEGHKEIPVAPDYLDWLEEHRQAGGEIRRNRERCRVGTHHELHIYIDGSTLAIPTDPFASPVSSLTDKRYVLWYRSCFQLFRGFGGRPLKSRLTLPSQTTRRERASSRRQVL
jgi:hypothetical protein